MNFCMLWNDRFYSLRTIFATYVCVVLRIFPVFITACLLFV